MKKLLILVLLVCLSGCEGSVTRTEFDLGVKACESNGGVEMVLADGVSHVVTFKCGNGAKFQYRTDKIWK